MNFLNAQLTRGCGLGSTILVFYDERDDSNHSSPRMCFEIQNLNHLLDRILSLNCLETSLKFKEEKLLQLFSQELENWYRFQVC